MSSTQSQDAEVSLTRFYERTLIERRRLLAAAGYLAESDVSALAHGQATLGEQAADRMVENVIGCFGLPMGVGLNFVIDGVARIVPMVVEEPSIIAALSSAAKRLCQGEGFRTEAPESLLIGQIQLLNLESPARAVQLVAQHQAEIKSLADSLHPNMVARGGGVREVSAREVEAPNGRKMVVVHLGVDTCDAMGANLVNTMCEGVAGLIEELTGGRAFLRILSNLTDRSMVRARIEVPLDALSAKGFTASEVRDGIIAAHDLASADIYRAVTHNKGIMNGIDAVALATGNDWRAIEAAAHAYAGRGEGYHPLTSWQVGLAGQLIGTIELPLKVGTKGGNLAVNPGVMLAQRILKHPTANELARTMACVGLAQNFAALRALATEGIQAGHMALHARSVVASVGAEPELFDEVVDKLLASQEIKLWKAEELLHEARERRRSPSTAPRVPTQTGCGFGKVVLAGEHAVVYGSHALVVPIPLAARAWVAPATQPGVRLSIPAWGVDQHLRRGQEGHSLSNSLLLLFEQLELGAQNVTLTIQPEVPRAMGLGSSAALAVAVVRALDNYFQLKLTDERVSALAFEAEKLAHGTPSGMDNALATVGRPIVFRRDETGPKLIDAAVGGPTELVIGMSHSESLTAATVRQVRKRRERNPELTQRLFNEIDHLALRAVDALRTHDLSTLGELMDLNHGLLHALHVSTPEIEQLVHIAREHGALGAKVTGGGGGGSMVALCADKKAQANIQAAMHRRNFRTLLATIV